MKKLFTRFKHWLIKKLGGNINAPSITHQYEIVRQRVSPIGINGATTLYANELMLMDDADMVRRTVESRVIFDIAHYIMENQLFEIDQCYNPMVDGVTYSARVMVLPPNNKPTTDDFNNCLVGKSVKREVEE